MGHSLRQLAKYSTKVFKEDNGVIDEEKLFKMIVVRILLALAILFTAAGEIKACDNIAPDTSCEVWKKLGYCTAGEFVPYMKGNCKKACGYCEYDCNMDLVNKINEYRQQNGLSWLPTDETLCKVAYYHARDTVKNRPDTGNCNMHSWSWKRMDGIKWKGCCYTRDHKNGKCMWKKPREFNSRFVGDGFEISYKTSGSANAEKALDSWKKSSGHNNVIMNRGIWTKNWSRIGAAYYGGAAHAWFAN